MQQIYEEVKEFHGVVLPVALELSGVYSDGPLESRGGDSAAMQHLLGHFSIVTGQ